MRERPFEEQMERNAWISDCYSATILSPIAVVRAQTKGETNYSSKGAVKGNESEKIVCAHATQTRSASNLSGGFLGPGAPYLNPDTGL